MYNSDLEIEALKSPNHKGFPRAATPTEDTEVIWRLRVTKRIEIVGPEPGASQTRQHISFFDLHAVFASICKCCSSQPASTSETENIVVTQPSSFLAGPEDKPTDLTETLSKKSGTVKLIHNPGGALRGIVGSASQSDRLRVATILFRGVAAQKVASPWTDTAALQSSSDFWAAY